MMLHTSWSTSILVGSVISKQRKFGNNTISRGKLPTNELLIKTSRFKLVSFPSCVGMVVWSKVLRLIVKLSSFVPAMACTSKSASHLVLSSLSLASPRGSFKQSYVVAVKVKRLRFSSDEMSNKCVLVNSKHVMLFKSVGLDGQTS